MKNVFSGPSVAGTVIFVLEGGERSYVLVIGEYVHSRPGGPNVRGVVMVGDFECVVYGERW